VQFKLKSPEPLLYHNEPIWKGDSVVGFIRSGMYGHSLGAAVGLGYVTTLPHATVPDAALPAAAGTAPAAIGADDYDIEVAGTRYPATASLQPLYDARNERIKC
jgi:4-methylaminobutanoate oxidase (formaldehyde-forming)